MCIGFAGRPADPYFVSHLADGDIDVVGPFDSDAVAAFVDSTGIRQQTLRHRMTECEMSAK